jgi:hypothetical protein
MDAKGLMPRIALKSEQKSRYNLHDGKEQEIGYDCRPLGQRRKTRH